MSLRLGRWPRQLRIVWKAFYAVILAVCTLSSAIAIASATTGVLPPSDDARTISGVWEYRLGDSPRRAGQPPDWVLDNSSSWQRISSPDKVALRSGQVAWLRTVVPPGTWEAPSLMVISSRMFFEIYLGGRYIFANSSFDQGVRGVAGNNWEIVTLPDGSAGQRLFFRIRAAGMGAEFSRVAIGAKIRHFSTIVSASTPRVLTSALLLSVAIIAFSLGVFRGATRGVVPLSVMSLLGAFYIVTGAPIRLHILRSGAVWDFFEVGALLLIPVGFCAYLAQMTIDRAQQYFRRAWHVHLGFAIICIILGGTGLMPMRYVLPLFDVLLFFNMVGTGYQLTIGVMRREPNMKNLALGAGVLVFAAFVDVFVGSLPGLYLAPVPLMGHLGLLGCVGVFAHLLVREALGESAKIQIEKEKFEKAYGAVLNMTGSHSILQSASSAAEVLVRALHVDRVCTVQVFVKNEIVSDDDSAFSSATLVSDGRLVENPTLVALKQKHEVAADAMLAKNSIFVTSRKLLIVPVIVNDRKWGFLTFDNYECSEPHPTDVEFIRLIGRGLSESLHGVNFVEETWKRAQADSEKELTESLQQLLLPKVVELPNAQVACNYSAADTTGGDWFGYYFHEKINSVDFFIGDVTGHGVQSALLAGVASGAVYSHEFTMFQDKFLCELPGPERIMRLARAVNRAVYEAGREKLFMSMLFVSIDLETGEGCYMNCGHHGFYWMQALSSRTTGVMPTQGNALGYSLNPQLSVEKFNLEQGDLLFLYSAGLLGNVGPDQKKLGVRKLKAILDRSRDPVEVQGLVLDAAKQIWQNQAAEDDVTTIVFKWLGSRRSTADTVSQAITVDRPISQSESA